MNFNESNFDTIIQVKPEIIGKICVVWSALLYQMSILAAPFQPRDLWIKVFICIKLYYWNT